jgi:hypothetical protein
MGASSRGNPGSDILPILTMLMLDGHCFRGCQINENKYAACSLHLPVVIYF